MKKTLAGLVQQHKGLSIFCSIFFILGAIVLLIMPKGNEFLWFNSLHNNLADNFFKLWTYLGDGITIILIALLLTWVNKRYPLLVISAFLFSALLAQAIKRIFNLPRPALYFNHSKEIYWPLGSETSLYNSFPSGHTTSAFMLATMLTLLCKNKRLGYVYFFLATLVALSRVYLRQHFFIDVYFGALLGMASSVFIYIMLNNRIKDPAAQHQVSLLA